MGEYVDAAAARWDVAFASNPYNPSNWQRFENEAAALEAWGLTYAPLPEPEPETEDYGVASPLPEPEGEQG